MGNETVKEQHVRILLSTSSPPHPSVSHYDTLVIAAILKICYNWKANSNFLSWREWTYQRLITMDLSKLSYLPYFTIVQSSCSVVSDSLRPHELQHARPPSPSQTPGVYSNSCPSSQWCHPAILSSVVPFSSCPQSLPASGSFPMSQLFAWGGQSTGISASASVLPMNTEDLSPSEWTGWISLQSKGLSKSSPTLYF